MATVEKVFGDQDYSIVSKKMEILEEEKLLNEKDLRIKQLQKRKAEIEKYRSHLNSMLIEIQVQVFRALGKDDGYQFEKKKEEVGEELMKITHEIDLVFKNIEIKKKARQNYYNNLLQLS